MGPASGSARSRTTESPSQWLERETSAASWRDLTERFTHHRLTRELQSGQIIRLFPNIYVAARQRAVFTVRAAAALMWAGPTAALGGTSAAHAHGLTTKPPSVVTLCMAPSWSRRPPDGLRIVQPAVVGTPTKARALRVAPLADAILQSWSQLGNEAGTSLILDAVRERRVTAATLAARAREYPRIRERRALARLLGPLGNGVESYLEHLAATRVFNTRDFAGFARQHRIQARGRMRILDLFHEDARVAIELDGRKFHSDDAARRRDLARDAELAAIGILTIRLTYEDIMGRPMWCRAQVRGAVAARRKRPPRRELPDIDAGRASLPASSCEAA